MATSGQPADGLTCERAPKGVNDDINPVRCEASESTGEGLTLKVDNVDPPKPIVCSRSGSLRLTSSRRYELRCSECSGDL